MRMKHRLEKVREIRLWLVQIIIPAAVGIGMFAAGKSRRDKVLTAIKSIPSRISDAFKD